MRTKENIDITTLNFDGFKANLKEAIEYASGSPFKKEAKLTEACAIALGLGNSDRMAAVKMAASFHSADALTLAKMGRCPFSREPVGTETPDRLGASFEVSEDGKKLIVHRFPKGMQVEDQAIWASSQPKGQVEVLGVPSSNFPGSRVYGEEPHLHAAIAGYREDLQGWFLSFEESSGNSAYTVAYWHTNYPEFASMPLAQRLQHETHYELVITFMDDGEVQILSLNRMFKLGNKWQISQDGNLDLNLYNRASGKGPDLNDPMLTGFLNLVIEGALLTPNEWAREGADPQSHACNLLIGLNVDGYFKSCVQANEGWSIEEVRLTSKGVGSDKVIGFIEQSLRTFEGPVMAKNLIRGPVVHPIR